MGAGGDGVGHDGCPSSCKVGMDYLEDDYVHLPAADYQALPWAGARVAIPGNGGSPAELGTVNDAFLIDGVLAYNVGFDTKDHEPPDECVFSPEEVEKFAVMK